MSVYHSNVQHLNTIDRLLRLLNRYSIQSDVAAQHGQTDTLPNVFFVDASLGNDANDGRDPAAPKLTITSALASCADGNDDVVICKGTFGEQVVITKAKVHLLGLQATGSDLSYLTRLNGNATGPSILIQARDVEVGFLMVSGNRDVGKNYAAIFVDGDTSGTRAYIHDVFVFGLTPSGTQFHNGIDIRGDRTVVERCVFDSQEKGIRVYSTVQATYEIIIRDCVFHACDVGIAIESLQESTGQHGCWVIDCLFDSQGAHSEDRAIKVTAGTPSLIRNLVTGYSTPFTNGSAKLVLNYNQASGGTLLT